MAFPSRIRDCGNILLLITFLTSFAGEPTAIGAAIVEFADDSVCK